MLRKFPLETRRTVLDPHSTVSPWQDHHQVDADDDDDNADNDDNDDDNDDDDEDDEDDEYACNKCQEPLEEGCATQPNPPQNTKDNPPVIIMIMTNFIIIMIMKNVIIIISMTTMTINST